MLPIAEPAYPEWAGTVGSPFPAFAPPRRFAGMLAGSGSPGSPIPVVLGAHVQLHVDEASRRQLWGAGMSSAPQRPLGPWLLPKHRS